MKSALADCIAILKGAATMKKRNKDAKRKAFYNDKRDCFLTVDGKYYCYRVWDEDGLHSTVQKFEVGKDLSVDLTVFLDDSDHDADLGDRYAEEHRDATRPPCTWLEKCSRMALFPRKNTARWTRFSSQNISLFWVNFIPTWR